MVFFATVRKQPVVIANEVAVFYMTQFFGNFGGMLHVNEHENEVFFLGVLVLAEQGVYKYAGSEFFMHRTDESNQVTEHEQLKYQNVGLGLFKEVQYVLQGGLVDKAFATVDVPNENAKRKVCANASQEKPGTNNEGGRNGSFVHFVL